MLSPDLAAELRAARRSVSPELRERVRAVAAQAPETRRRFAWPSLRQVALVGAAAAIAISVGAAAVYGIVHSGSPDRDQLAASRRKAPAAEGAGTFVQRPPAVRRTATTTLPPTASRLQQYGASLRIQVRDRQALSNATRRAMRIARLLGGYVASVQYSSPRDGRGAAALVVRVPVDRVQDAVEEYSALGTILGQKLRITDVTKAVQEQAKEIARLRTDLARLEAGGITPSERPRYDAENARLDFLRKKRKATVRRAELARISLRLITKPKASAAAPGRLHRTLSDAADVLVREAELLLYALIVAGPLLLLGGGAIATARLAQRRRDAQLLERT